MKLHRNAALSWSGRRRLVMHVVVERATLVTAARSAGVSVRCARKWVSRYRAEGERGLYDRSSASRRVANQSAWRWRFSSIFRRCAMWRPAGCICRWRRSTQARMPP